MQRELTLIPAITIHPDKICTYFDTHWDPSPPPRKINFLNVPCNINSAAHLQSYSRTADGRVSKIAKKKITRALDYLLLLTNSKMDLNRLSGKMVKFKISFITLTLPSVQIHDDNTIKRTCLNSFILEIQKYYKVQNYLWRAEKQKNGNLHFHIITDKFIPWSEIRDRWNRIVNKLGYVDRYRTELKKFHSEGFQVRSDLLKTWNYKAQIKAYQTGKANDWNNPNSTDIHGVDKINSIRGYICKYMVKNDIEPIKCENSNTDYSTQKGRIWGSSEHLQKITGAQIIADSNIYNEVEQIIKKSNCKTYSENYFTIYYIDFKDLFRLHAKHIFKAFSDYLIQTFGFSIQLSFQ